MTDEERAHSLAQIAAQIHDGGALQDALTQAEELLTLSIEAVERRGNRERLASADILVEKAIELSATTRGKTFSLVDAIKDITAACSYRDTEKLREKFAQMLGSDLLSFFEERGEVSGVEIVYFASVFRARWTKHTSPKPRQNRRKSKRSEKK